MATLSAEFFEVDAQCSEHLRLLELTDVWVGKILDLHHWRKLAEQPQPSPCMYIVQQTTKAPFYNLPSEKKSSESCKRMFTKPPERR
jgi:hypothetical protein